MAKAIQNAAFILERVQRLEVVLDNIRQFEAERDKLRAELNRTVLAERSRSNNKTLKFHDNGKLYVLVAREKQSMIDMHISAAPGIHAALGEESMATAVSKINPLPSSIPSEEDPYFQ